MNSNKPKRKGYRKVYEDESGSTSQGRKKVVGVYNPLTNTGKTIERDITYKTKDTPRKKFTDKEVTKKWNDGSIKSYKHVIKEDGKIIREISTKEKYKK